MVVDCEMVDCEMMVDEMMVVSCEREMIVDCEKINYFYDERLKELIKNKIKNMIIICLPIYHHLIICLSPFTNSLKFSLPSLSNKI